MAELGLLDVECHNNFSVECPALLSHQCCCESLLAIFIVIPSGLIKLSTGLADGCNGGIFSSCIPRSSANVFIAMELNGGPLSESCFAGQLRLLA